MSDNIGVRYINTEDMPWTIDVDGRFVNVIKQSLSDDGMPDEGISQTINNAAEILGYCPDTTTTESCSKTGIVIGKVQSGKTSNFIALTAMAFDNGYDVVTVFGGTKNILVRQNRTRITEYFNKAQEVYVLDSVDYKSQLTAANIKQFIRMGKKVIIVALKHPKHINPIREDIFSDPVLADHATLIIDDEGDEASLNGLVKKNKKTATYLAIEKLKQQLDKHAFVSVTATPQANLLIDALDVLSPEFGVLVNPGKGYCGLDVFHSDDTYTVTIPETEDSLLDDGVPESFIKALSMYFVACGIHKSRYNNPGEKMSMLVHPSHLVKDHTVVHKKVLGIIDDWRQVAANRTDLAYADIQMTLKNAYEEYKSSGVKGLLPFEDLEDSIVDAINFCGVHIVNGSNVLNDSDAFYDYNIYVGGSMLGRGLTLKGLTITYIIRTPKGKTNVDTAEQRARWFGYKAKYLDLCRIFAVPKIIKEFEDIRDHEEDLWDNVQRAHLQGTKFKDISRIFTLSDGLNMTRSNVAKVSSFSFSFWNKQKAFQSDVEYTNSNNSIISKIREDNADKLKEEKYGQGAPYVVLMADFDYIKTELLDKFTFPADLKLNNQLVDRLDVLMKHKGIHPSIKVIWMRDGEESLHRIDDGKIPNYSVGRRPKDKSLPTVYAGDDYQFVEDDTLQLQIHTIKDKITGHVSPALALYIPKNVIEHLTNLVIRED